MRIGVYNHLDIARRTLDREKEVNLRLEPSFSFFAGWNPESTEQYAIISIPVSVFVDRREQ